MNLLSAPACHMQALPQPLDRTHRPEMEDTADRLDHTRREVSANPADRGSARAMRTSSANSCFVEGDQQSAVQHQAISTCPTPRADNGVLFAETPGLQIASTTYAVGTAQQQRNQDQLRREPQKCDLVLRRSQSMFCAYTSTPRCTDRPRAALAKKSRKCREPTGVRYCGDLRNQAKICLP